MGNLFDGDVFTQFDFPGGTGIQTGAINDRGQVVGISIDSAGALHGFLASKEQFNGNALSVGAGQDNAAVEIAGTFTSQTDLDQRRNSYHHKLAQGSWREVASWLADCHSS
jgi:probable HAF family extracellular repeat protein